MILGHDELVRRLSQLFPEAQPLKVGPASADVTVGGHMIREGWEHVYFVHHDDLDPAWLAPGERVLVDMLERVQVPLDLAAMFTLRSTQARDAYRPAHFYGSLQRIAVHGEISIQ